VAINTFPRAGDLAPWRRSVDAAAAAGADAVILADIGLLDYAARRHPGLRRHLSVQAAASNPLSIDFYREAFGVSRVVLPRVLAVKEVAALIARMKIEAEVFAFGSLGTMVEGRCYLSSYITGRSPSSDGACAPAEFVSYREEGGKMVSRLGDVIRTATQRRERRYPTPCKSRLMTPARRPICSRAGWSQRRLDPQELKGAGVTALKIEGRQRKPRLRRRSRHALPRRRSTPWRAARRRRARSAICTRSPRAAR